MGKSRMFAFCWPKKCREYLLPYIEQALTDVTESVIANALDCLAILCRSSFLRKMILLEMIDHAFPLLCCPSQWVRRSAVAFIAASSESLGAVDSYVFLVPVIRPFLRRQPASLASEKTLFSCLKPPVPREIYYKVLENAKVLTCLTDSERYGIILRLSLNNGKLWTCLKEIPLKLIRWHTGMTENMTVKVTNLAVINR